VTFVSLTDATLDPPTTTALPSVEQLGVPVSVLKMVMAALEVECGAEAATMSTTEACDKMIKPEFECPFLDGPLWMC